ncbi:MAG: T9SS type A sorting domain-containing protein [Bacteroidota bacterium]
MIKKTTFLFVFLVCSFVTAQETIVSAANESTGSNGSVAFSVGLISVETLESADGSVSQGIQIPLEVTQLLSVDDPQFNNVSVQVYPNPTTDVVIINSGNHTDLGFQLYDIHGKLMTQQNNKMLRQISLKGYKSGVYLFKILHENKAIKTFKILKK